MTEHEWIDRYTKRIAQRAGCTDDVAQRFVRDAGLSFQELSEMFEDDPEGAADEEIFCWEAD